MSNQIPEYKKASNKWWDNWWKNTFSTPTDPESFTFFPGINFIADKLKINSFKGFIILIIILILLAIGVSLGINFIFKGNSKLSESSGITNTKAGQVISAWTTFPDLRLPITLIFIICILGALVIWWFFYRDN